MTRFSGVILFIFPVYEGEKGNEGPPGKHGQKGAPGENGSPAEPGSNSSGVSYVRWGRTTCPGEAEIVYTGE